MVRSTDCTTCRAVLTFMKGWLTQLARAVTYFHQLPVAQTFAISGHVFASVVDLMTHQSVGHTV